MISVDFSAIQCAFVSAQEPGTNFGTSEELRVGLVAPDSWCQSFIQFDLSRLPLEINITNAAVRLYLQSVFGVPTQRIIQVFPVIQSWNENEITFLTRPLFESTPVKEITIFDQVDTYISFDVTTLVKDWHYGKLQNFGIILHSVTPFVTFASSHAANMDKRTRPKLQVEYQPASFDNIVEQDITTTDEIQYTAPQNISGLRQVSYFISNTGANEVAVQLDVSPDGNIFMVDVTPTLIAPGESVVLVPRFFLQYTRLGYQSATPGQPTVIDIWFQGQGR